MPGIAASTSETWLLGGAPKPVEEPEKSFARSHTSLTFIRLEPVKEFRLSS